MSSVKLENINKSYTKDVPIIRNLNLNISSGEFAVIVGPSGCGKSTLLRLIAGLEEVTDGEIFIDDNRVTTMVPKDRNISMVFQNYALYPQMTVFDNMAFGLKMRKKSKTFIKEKIKWASNKLGLEEYLFRRPKELSGGQKQRVALGRAIVREPEVFLFDEPLSNLDAKLRIQMRSVIKSLHDELGTTMIYVTHDQVEAMTLGTKIIALNKGKIHQVDTPINLYNDPADTFVGKFIGNPGINLLSFSKKENSEIEIKNGQNNSVTIKSNELKDILKNYEKEKVLLGLRPEYIDIKNSNENKNAIKGKLKLIEPLGNETLYHISLNENQIISRQYGKSKSDALLGQDIYFNFEIKNAIFFDIDTKKRIVSKNDDYLD